MPGYHYLAKTFQQELKSGYIQANNKERAYQKLRTMDFYPLWMRESKKESSPAGLTVKQLEGFCNATAIMIKAGMPLLNVLYLLSHREKESKMRRFCYILYQQMLTGISFSEALEGQLGICPKFIVTMVRAGERGGQLLAALEQLQQYYEMVGQIRKKVIEAFIYPLFLLGLMAVVMILLFVVILPTFFGFFDTLQNLPWYTKLFLNISKMITAYPVELLSGLLAFVILISAVSRNPRVRNGFFKIVIKMGIIGTALRKINTALFAQGMSTLYGSGVELVAALQLTTDMMPHHFLRVQLKQIQGEVCDGRPLSVCISSLEGVDDSLAEAIYIGEEAGELCETLKRVSEQCGSDAKSVLKYITTLIEPTLIVIIAIMAGIVMMAVMVPMLRYYESIG